MARTGPVREVLANQSQVLGGNQVEKQATRAGVVITAALLTPAQATQQVTS
jgi:hypothetical protein